MYKYISILIFYLIINIINGSIQDKNIIVRMHNYYRSIVNPVPTNMYLMHWNDTLANKAQILANKCLGLTHDSTGQNIFMSINKQYSYKYAIQRWASEKQYFNYGVPILKNILHYTQIIWDQTYAVGCGYKVCPNKMYIFICNYYPPGNNINRLYTPYKIK